MKKRIRIMHLSDLHFGGDFWIQRIRTGRWRPPQRPDHLKKSLVKQLKQLQPDYLVITGDCVSSPRISSSESVVEYLKDVFLEANFDFKKRLLMVPGNHDVPFRRITNESKRLSSFAQLQFRLFGEERDIRKVVTFPEDKILFLCLDSTLKSAQPIAEGEIGDEQLEWITERLNHLHAESAETFEEYIKIALVHHHCTSMADQPARDARAMELLDSADLVEKLQHHSFHIVLHGHRHVPHIKPILLPEQRVLTIVGSGTTTHVVPEEQHGHGNNFTVIDIYPDKNLLTHRLYKANAKNMFEPASELEGSFPLVTADSHGYTIAKTRKIIVIEPSGVKHVAVRNEGVNVVNKTTMLDKLPFQVTPDVAGGRIVDFNYEVPGGYPHYEINTDHGKKGSFVLREPLSSASSEISIAYSYTLLECTPLSVADLDRMSPNAIRKEGFSSLNIVNPMNKLEFEIFFPWGFRQHVSVRAERAGLEIPLKEMKPHENWDALTGRYILKIGRPLQGVRIIVAWELPAV